MKFCLADWKYLWKKSRYRDGENRCVVIHAWLTITLGGTAKNELKSKHAPFGYNLESHKYSGRSGMINRLRGRVVKGVGHLDHV